MARTIKGEVLEQKVYPCCEECKFLVIQKKGIFIKKFTFDCSAQGFQPTSEVYGTENCNGNFYNQLFTPIAEMK